MSDPTHQGHHRFETRRLIIRSAEPGDAEAIAALRGNPDNNPFGTADSGDPETYLRRMVNWQKASEEGRYDFTVILLRSSGSPHPTESRQSEGKLIGFGGFNEFRRVKSLNGLADSVLEVDIGAQIDHKFWRQGYGLEATIGMIEYAFSELHAAQISCDTDLQNEAWRELMKTLGLEKKEQIHVNPQGHPEAGEKSWLWQFDLEEWATARNVMTKSEKQPV